MAAEASAGGFNIMGARAAPEHVSRMVLHSLFKRFDRDNSDSIDKKELGALLSAIGLDVSAEIVHRLVDRDNNGKISFAEFFAWLRSDSLERHLTGQRYLLLVKAHEMFKKYDKDGSGAISRDEFAQLCSDLGVKDQTGAGLAALDKDGSGVIEFAEFLDWLGWLK